ATMCVLVILLSFLSISLSQDAAFLKKYNSLVSCFMGPNTPKFVNLVADGMVAQKTSAELKEDVGKNVFSYIPSPKVMPALNVISTYGKCVNSTGKTNPSVTSDAITFAFNKFIQPLAKKIIAKVDGMKKSKKADKAVKTEVFKIATAGLTKKLIQNFLDAVKSKMTQPVWNCGVPVLNEFMETKNYDMV
ncbi:hypothetical protein PRIPAC_79774, partial [Pristionchus pacificus]